MDRHNIADLKEFLKFNRDKLSEMFVGIEDLPPDDEWILDDGWDEIYERMEEYKEESSN